VLPVDSDHVVSLGVKVYDGEGKFKYDIFDITTFINATMYPQHKKKKGKKEEMVGNKRILQ
jgi:hypothetical protein